MASMDHIYCGNCGNSSSTNSTLKLNPAVRFMFLGVYKPFPGFHCFGDLDAEAISEALCYDGSDALDGIYLEFDPEIMPGQPRHSKFRELCARTVVGIWMNPHDPDTLGVCEQLVNMGVQYVNTDLSRGFLEDEDDSSHKDVIDLKDIRDASCAGLAPAVTLADTIKKREAGQPSKCLAM